MRIKWAKRVILLGLALFGTALLILAFFAYDLHIGHNQVMGPARLFLAYLGTVFLLMAACILLYPLVNHLLKAPSFTKINHFIHLFIGPLLWLWEPVQKRNETHKPGKVLFALAGALIASFFSLWFMTSGKIVVWSPYSDYFNLQANAFLAGKLSLLEKPPAALVALADPYKLQNRAGVGNYIWDSSLYQGKYYLYWGPVPALMAATVKLFHPAWVIEDQYLILFSIIGLAFVLAALFYWLSKDFFSNIPGFVVTGLIILGVLNTPVFWLINRPDVYEASIAVGQFFLILGIYTALRGVQSKKHKLIFMTLTGIFWGAAIGSRVDLGLGIFWMLFLISLFLFLGSEKRQVPFGVLSALLFPIIISGAGLAWYNYARFGNILETGHRFQLTGGALPANYSDIFSASYILPNLYNLLARPMEILWHEFPFFFTPYISNSMWPKFLFYPRNSNYFYIEQITGIFISMPAIWLLLIPLLSIPLTMGRNWLKERPFQALPIKDQPLTTWMAWMLTGAVFFNLGILSIFITSTMRYEADLTPLLTILIGLFIGWGSIKLQSYPRLWRILLFVVVILILISIIIGLFTNFQNGDRIFKTNNPALYQSIANFFSAR